MDSLPDHIVYKILEEVSGITFFRLPEVCQHWSRVFYIVLEENDKLKRKHEVDAEIRDIMSSFTNPTIEEIDHGTYWIQMFRMTLTNLKSLSNRLPIRKLFLNYNDGIRVEIFGKEIYRLSKDKLMISDIQFPEKVILSRNLPYSWYSLTMFLFAPNTYNKFTPLPYILRIASTHELEIFMYNKKTNSVELVTSLLTASGIHAFKFRDNYFLIIEDRCVEIFKMLPISQTISQISRVHCLEHDMLSQSMNLIEFYRDGFLILRKNILDYYSLRNNNVVKVFSYPIVFSDFDWQRDFVKYSYYLQVVKGYVFIYSSVNRRIFVVENIDINPTMKLIAEDCKHVFYFKIFINKWIDYCGSSAIDAEYQDRPNKIAETKLKVKDNSLEILKCLPYILTEDDYVIMDEIRKYHDRIIITDNRYEEISFHCS